jgi:hypothetical protein
LIRETIAPGLYLLPENAMDEAADALEDAGIDIIARRCDKIKTAAGFHDHFPTPASGHSKKIPSAPSTVSKTDNHAAVLTANFHAILKKMPMGELERIELAARIDRRLVLSKAQLQDANVRYEKLEARHMDYAGKQNIAKQAISQQSPVEIHWHGGGSESIFGTPKALEKENGELVLVVAPSDGDVMRIPLGKISLLRRIKKSIFEV